MRLRGPIHYAHNVHYVNSPEFLNPRIVVNPMARALPVTAD